MLLDKNGNKIVSEEQLKEQIEYLSKQERERRLNANTVNPSAPLLNDEFPNEEHAFTSIVHYPRSEFASMEDVDYEDNGLGNITIEDMGIETIKFAEDNLRPIEPEDIKYPLYAYIPIEQDGNTVWKPVMFTKENRKELILFVINETIRIQK